MVAADAAARRKEKKKSIDVKKRSRNSQLFIAALPDAGTSYATRSPVYNVSRINARMPGVVEQ